MKPALILLLAAGMTFAAQAQDSTPAPTPTPTPRRQVSPEDMKQAMESSLGAMVPMMQRMTEGMIEAQLAAAENPETARRVAAFKKNLYDELQKQGFSKRDVLTIVQTTALPGASASQR
jgi:hypothetical protein